MLVTLVRTTNGFTFTMTSRTNSSVSYTTNVVTSSNITGFNLYEGDQSDGAGQRNIFFDDFLSTNSGVFSTGGTVTNGNIFSGSGNLSIGNSTILVLSGSGNNYSGTTTISNGTTLRFTGNNSAFGSSLSGGGTLSVTAGSTALTGANSGFTGKTTITGGTLSINADERLGAAPGAATADQLTLGGGTLETTASFGLAANRGITLSSGTVSTMFVAAGTALTNNAAITGSGEMGKNGTGTLVLAAANTHSGQTLLREGVMLVGNNAAFGTGSFVFSFATNTAKTLASLGSTARTITNEIQIYNDATLGEAAGNTGKLTFAGGTFLGNEPNQYRTLTVAAGNEHEFSGGITGLRGIIKAGTGTLTLSGNNSFGTSFQLNDGTVLVGHNNAFGSGVLQVQFDTGGTKTIASSSASAFTIGNSVNVFNGLNLGLASVGTGALTFGGTFYLGDEPGQYRIISTAAGTGHTVSGAVTGLRGIVKQGTGTLTLSGANTSTGALLIDDGTLQLDGGSLAAGQIDIGSGVDGEQDSNNATLRVAAGTFAANITVNAEGTAGSRSIQFANSTGSATLSGAVALEKAVSVSTAGAQGILSGAIAGSGGLTKTGAGTLTLSGSGANTYGGITTVSAGVLELFKSSGNAIAGATTISSGATLLLSASNQVDSGAGDTVTLSGGTIERASGITEVFGNLNVTQASFINFSGGTGNSITFTGLNYTPSALLSLQLLNFTQGNTLVFQNTTDMSSLIGSGFTFGGSGGFGSTSFSGGTFTITAIPEPSTYVAAAALLTLLLWPSRRRLLKDAKSILGLRALAEASEVLTTCGASTGRPGATR
jgi:autotransporter-associated beta strand protein